MLILSGLKVKNYLKNILIIKITVGLVYYIRIRITSLDIINNLSTHRAKIINILDFNSKKLSIIKTKTNKIHVYYDHKPFFLSIDNLKGYFEERDDKNNIVGKAKNNKYLTMIFYW